jgi:outer membrane protease
MSEEWKYEGRGITITLQNGVMRQLIAENREPEEPMRRLSQLLWKATNAIRSSGKLTNSERSDLTDMWVEAFSVMTKVIMTIAYKEFELFYA